MKLRSYSIVVYLVLGALGGWSLFDLVRAEKWGALVLVAAVCLLASLLADRLPASAWKRRGGP